MTPQDLYDEAATALSCLEGNHPDGAFADAPEVAADILRAALQKWTRTHQAPKPRPQQQGLAL